jgi:hypothetical protein
MMFISMPITFIHTSWPTSDCIIAGSKHGNELNKGAKIDAKLKAEEEEELRKRGKLN